ncbi:hypothetical protein BDZ45DRAFT_668645 [Acephala macrosclerotiorum]|nr:hypothetical protein BDZ45DRAFT_668645 [Acephala macrosclerotiorum]
MKDGIVEAEARDTDSEDIVSPIVEDETYEYTDSDGNSNEGQKPIDWDDSEDGSQNGEGVLYFPKRY